MKTPTKEEIIGKEFHVSIYVLVYEFVVGTAELLSGVAIALYGSRMYQLYQASLIKVLDDDPDDLLARISEKFVPNILNHSSYVVLYLLALGLVKIVGAIGLVQKKNWGVDLLVGLILLMAPFQITGLIVHHNLLDLLYLVVGLLIALYLIEFRPAAWISRILKFK